MSRSESKPKYVVGNGNCVFNLYLKNDFDSVDFYLGKELVIKVDRQKFLRKSAYFQAISKKCYKLDHESEFVEVYFPFGKEMFMKVMNFINSDVITLDIRSLFETYHVAEYLLIDCLKQTCLRHFTYNLNRKTVGAQLKKLEKCSFPVEKLKERAASFERSGHVSFSGLYFLQEYKRYGACLKVKSEHSKDAIALKFMREKDRILSKLHYFDNMLCWVQHNRELMAVELVQYDLLSGKTFDTVVGDSEHFVRSSICTDGENLYLLLEYRSGAVLTLTVFRRPNDKEGLKVCREKELGLPHDKFKHAYFKFAHCHDGKLYVFYEPRETTAGGRMAASSARSRCEPWRRDRCRAGGRT